MNCDWVKSNITLYVFDELEDAGRIEIEQHLTRCRDCSREAEAEKTLRQIMDLRPKVEPSASLLAECRMNLAELLEEEPAPQTTHISRWREWFSAPFSGLNRQWQAGLAVALISLGFVSGSVLSTRAIGGNILSPNLLQNGPINGANIAGVHTINTRPDGKVEISLDTLQRRNVVGTPDDPQIRQVLVTALGDYNSGVRLETIEVLSKEMESGGAHSLVADPQVRAGLITSLRGDKNPGARLKALQALKGFESDAAVRQAILSAMVSDSNSGVRIAAIDMVANSHESSSDRLTIGALQQLAADDANSYIRLKSADTLRKWNRPVEVY